MSESGNTRCLGSLPCPLAAQVCLIRLSYGGFALCQTVSGFHCNTLLMNHKNLNASELSSTAPWQYAHRFTSDHVLMLTMANRREVLASLTSMFLRRDVRTRLPALQRLMLLKLNGHYAVPDRTSSALLWQQSLA